MANSPRPKSVVVTGANGGIGCATVVELARHGYDVIGTVRSPVAADDVARAADEVGVSVRTLRCDVADAAATQAAFAQIAEVTDGGPWALVNNAGYVQAGAVEDVSDERARRQLEVNTIAPARTARLVLPTMRARGDGRIVNVSSVAGRVSAPLVGWYCASKHALEALSDAMRIEVAPFGVKVILIEPGGMDTAIWASGRDTLPRRDDTAYAAAYDRAEAATKQSRWFPDPVWVARTIRLALANPLPMTRYLVGVDAVAGTVADTVVPTPITDYVKGVSAGLRRLPVPLPFSLRRRS
jgi:NAD(P)-dependent dehydrogenase (short-subunit alcohol dehydrogenase family)